MAKRSSDDHNLDHTDELPILLETVVLHEDTETGLDDTAGHTAIYHGLESDDARELQPDQSAATDTEEIEALEAQLRGIADLNRELEQQLAERDRTIEDLKGTVASLRSPAEAAAAAQRQLATQLALRDARLSELSATIDRLHEESAASAAEIERLKGEAELARLDAKTASKAASPMLAPSELEAEIESLREENATLSSYIEGRRKWWNELQEAHGNLALRETALTHELATSEKLREAAAHLAARESSRAIALRGELATYARRVEELERKLKQGRTIDSAITDTGGDVSDPDALSLTRTGSHAAELGPATLVSAPGQTPPDPAPDEAEAGPSMESLAQLEAEVAYKRQQIAAQLVELHEREQRLRTATEELERLGQERRALHRELDEGRATIARLEQTVMDKDRAIAARDSRIDTLQEELNRRTSSAEDSNAEALATRKPNLAFGSHALETPPAAAALLCLTGDAPPRFLLTKESVIVGRGTQCDLQILTHFVSREHARITMAGDVAVIEDLGSRNGVYVNSVRVDKRELHQGDVIVIGETQFRFVESMAH